MTQKLIIGLVGQRCSGKGTAASFLKARYKVETQTFSHVLNEILALLGPPGTRKNLQNLAMDLRRRFGQDVLVKPLKKFINESRARIVVVDGLRVWAEVEMLRSFKNNLLVYIAAPAKIRFERLKKSGGKAGREGVDFKGFLRLDGRETELLIKKIGKKADVVVDNTGTKEDLYKKIDQIIKKRID